MQTFLLRYKSNDTATLGKFYIEKDFQCYILEDPYRPVKIKHKTRIPEGNYEIILRKYGRFHNIFLKRYPEFHIGMLEIKDVPNFTDILIHPGNSAEDTSGCLLTGNLVDEEKMFIRPGTSIPAYEKIYKKLSKVLKEGEKVFIKILDIEINPKDVDSIVNRELEKIKRD